MEAYKERGPYTYESRFTIDEVLTPPNWKLNITGNVEVRFILPADAEPLIPESGRFIIDFEEDRPVALFVHNSPKTLQPNTWRVSYDLTSLRNVFWLGIVSITVFISIFVAIVFSKTSSRIFWGLITAISSPLFLYNLYSFLNLGVFKYHFNLLLMGEVVLMVLITIASAKKVQETRVKND